MERKLDSVLSKKFLLRQEMFGLGRLGMCPKFLKIRGGFI